MSFLYLTVLFPLIGFVLLAAGRKKPSEKVAALFCVGAGGRLWGEPLAWQVTVGQIGEGFVAVFRHQPIDRGQRRAAAQQACQQQDHRAKQ